MVDLECSNSANMRLSCSILAIIRSISEAGCAAVVDQVAVVDVPRARIADDSSNCSSSQRTVSKAAYNLIFICNTLIYYKDL